MYSMFSTIYDTTEYKSHLPSEAIQSNSNSIQHFYQCFGQKIILSRDFNEGIEVKIELKDKTYCVFLKFFFE